MTVPRGVVPAVAVVLALGACGGSGEARTTAATVPAGAATVTTAPAAAHPYSLAEVQAIVDEIDRRLQPVVDRFAVDHMPSLELYAELAEAYSGKGLERMKASFGRAAAGVWAVAPPPLRAPTTEVVEILHATDSCLLVRGPRDWSGTFPEIPLHDGALELKLTDKWRYHDEVWTDQLRPMAEQTRLCA